jgi:glyoxylase-like metal-dependent hydrolase (beta-lactamase superfamily II)
MGELMPNPQLLQRVSEHVHWLAPDPATDRPILGVVAGEQATLIVDAGNSPAHAQLLLRSIAGLGLPPLKYLALTHWHWDHIFGAHTLNLLTFAHQETRRVVAHLAGLDWRDAALDARVASGEEIIFCADNMKKELPDRGGLVIKVPEVGFSQRVELDLGGVTCQIVHVGGDHSPDSSVVYIPEDRVLFFSDCLSEDYYSGAPSYTVAKLLPLIDTLLSFEADHFFGGHTNAVITRQDFIADTDMLRMIGQEVQHAAGDRPAILAALRARLGADLPDDPVEVMDAFLAGLSKMQSAAKASTDGA